MSNIPVIGLMLDRKSDISVALTPIGKKKAEAFALTGPTADVLASLAEKGAMTLKEVSDVTDIDVARVRNIVISLIRSGYVKKL